MRYNVNGNSVKKVWLYLDKHFTGEKMSIWKPSKKESLVTDDYDSRKLTFPNIQVVVNHSDLKCEGSTKSRLEAIMFVEGLEGTLMYSDEGYTKMFSPSPDMKPGWRSYINGEEGEGEWLITVHERAFSVSYKKFKKGGSIG